MPFLPGQSGNPAGIPKELAALRSHYQAKRAATRELIISMLEMTPEKSAEFMAGEDSNKLSQLIAMVIDQLIEKPDVYQLKELLTMAMGSFDDKTSDLSKDELAILAIYRSKRDAIAHETAGRVNS